MTIRNPIEWGGAQFVSAAHVASRFHHSLHHISETIHSPMPRVARISTADVWQSLREGFADFEAYRSDVLFLCAFYAVVGLVTFRLALGGDFLPLMFPLASGFAIVGPIAALGLYEMSRRREQGAEVNWTNAFDILKSPDLGAIAVLSLGLIALFLAWLFSAWVILNVTLGAAAPTALGPFLNAVFFTPQGAAMIVLGLGVGFCFALLAMMMSVVSFPLLVDRDTGLDTAVKTSFRAVVDNPKPMALWGLMVAAILAAGTAVCFVGLMVAVPVLGHATWHLYKKLVVCMSLGRHFLVVGGVAAAVVIAAAVIAPRTAHGAATSLKQCFASTDIRGWVAPDPKTLYLRVNANRIYRVDLSRQCSPLSMHGARLITRSFGPDLICSPVDWNLRASDGGPGDIPEPCFIQSITALSPEDAAALPKNEKP